jgi:hypothetical protein
VTCTDKAVTVGVAGSDGFQQETVLRVFRDPEVGGAWSQQVCGQFDEDGDAVPLFLIHDETLNCGKWWEWLKRLTKVDNMRYRLMAMGEKCDNLDVHFESEAVAWVEGTGVGCELSEYLCFIRFTFLAFTTREARKCYLRPPAPTAWVIISEGRLKTADSKVRPLRRPQIRFSEPAKGGCLDHWGDEIKRGCTGIRCG